MSRTNCYKINEKVELKKTLAILEKIDYNEYKLIII